MLSRSSVVSGHVALMPDAHVGMGATIGSVIPTENAIIPSAVGVDIGCGMIACHTSLNAADLPSDLQPLVHSINRSNPCWCRASSTNVHLIGHLQWMDGHPLSTDLESIDKPRIQAKALRQLGTLGSGNHFLEVCLDKDERVWVVLHSGSRGVGNILATQHIRNAKGLAKELERSVEDADLAYYLKSDPEFTSYIDDMLWAQDYALENREIMMSAALKDLFHFVGQGQELSRINCHHNFAALETHDGREVWITRKGAINAEVGKLGRYSRFHGRQKLHSHGAWEARILQLLFPRGWTAHES